MDVLTLRSQLASALSGLVGTYTLSNGSTTPSISVRKIGEGLFPGTSVTGLEVVIVQEADLEPVSIYGAAQVRDSWTVYLVAWGASADIATAGQRIIAGFPGGRVETVSVPEGVGPKNQLRCTIPSMLFTSV